MIPSAFIEKTGAERTKAEWRQDACGDLHDFLYGAGDLGDSDTLSFPYQWRQFKTYFITALTARVRGVETLGAVDWNTGFSTDIDCKAGDYTNNWDRSTRQRIQEFSTYYSFTDTFYADNPIELNKYGWEGGALYLDRPFGTVTCALEYRGQEIPSDAEMRTWMEERWSDYVWQIRKHFKSLEMKYEAMRKAMVAGMEKQLLVCDMAQEQNRADYFVVKPEMREKFCTRIRDISGHSE